MRKKHEQLQGAYYEPSVLTGVTQNMRVWKEEVFGPVLPIVAFKTTEEAMALAQDTFYGLGSYIFTEDNHLAAKTAQAMRAGMVQINNAVINRPCNPFLGRGLSGLGLENDIFGFHDVCRRKLVVRNK